MIQGRNDLCCKGSEVRLAIESNNDVDKKFLPKKFKPLEWKVDRECEDDSLDGGKFPPSGM